MYYGNAAAPDGQNPDGVWTEGYRAVYHLNETGTAFDDSTARDLDGSVSSGTTSVNGLIGGARDFEETSADSIDLGVNQNYLKSTSVGTLSAWINPETLSGDGAIVGIAVGGATPQSSSRFSILASGDNVRVFARSTDSTAAEVDVVTTTSPLTAGSWHYVTAVVDYANDSVDIYVDGVLQTISGTVSFASGTTPNTASSATAIGANEDKANEFFDGIIDEVHIAHAARSADWIKAEYESQKDQFVTFGYQQTVSGVLGNDIDQESDVLTASLVSDVSNGALVLNADGTFQYTPNAGFGGTDSFVYQVDDGSNNTSVSTVYITVNDAPVANNDSYSVGQDQTLTITSTSTAKSTATDLEALWNFNDGVTDATGNANDGATYGDATWVTSSRTGEAALSFDGVDDYIETTSSTLDLSTATSFTLSAWFQTDTTAGQHHILWQGVSTENGWGTPADETPTSSEMHLSIGHWDAAVNNKITFFMGYHDLGPASINIISDSDFTDTGGWHNAVVVVSDLGGGKLQADLYIDGVLEGSDTGMEIDRSLWDTGFRIGGGGPQPPAGNVRNFDGMIDEVAVYNRDLTSSEVHEIYTAGIIANDSDADGDFLTASLVTGPVSGSLLLQEDGSFTYTPNAGFSGTDTFTYKVNDGSLDSNIATVTINVINNAPVATDDPGEFNTSISSYNPLSYWRLGESSGTTAADDGGTGNTATYNGVTVGQTGAISGDGDTSISFDGTDDYVEIAHDDAYLIDDGTVQLWFKADDLLTEQGLFSKDSNSFDTGGHFTIRLKTDGSVEVRLQSTTDSYYVSSLPGSVTAGSWHHVAVNFGSNGMELFLDGVSVDTNPYTGGLGSSSGGIGNYEPIAIGANTWQTGDLNLTGMNQFFGGSIDEVAIIDQALTAEQIQTIYASAVQNYTVAENSSLVIPAAEGVLVNDLDAENDVLTTSLVSDVSYGALTLNPDGSFTYTPDAEFSGTDSFTYVANDGNNDSNVATVTITITGDNDAPVNTVPGTQVVLEDTQTSIPGISVTDPDAGPGIISTQLSVSNGILDVTLAGTAIISAGANGSNNLTISGTVDDINATLGTLKYTGDANLFGIAADTLTVVTNDMGNTGTGGAQSDADTVQINITAVNDIPVAADDSYSVNEDQTLVINALNENTSSVDLSAAWQLDEGAGITITDTTANGNDGTISGASWTTTDRTGGSALQFDGVDDSVNLGTDTTVDNIFAGGGTVS
ncbi:MAG: Ig-like domain-containing protein, partial [Gammaproteobacteria bacterium]